MGKTAGGFGGFRRPFLRFGIALVVGIGIGYWHGGLDCLPLPHLLLALSLCYALFWLLQWYKGVYRWGTLFGMFAMAMLVLVGYVRVLQQHPRGRKSHFVHRLDRVEAYEGIVSGIPRKIGFRQNVLLSVRRVLCDGEWFAVSGRCKLIFPSRMKKVVDGVTLRVEGHPVWMRTATNPHVIDYNSMWRLQGAFHEHVVKNAAIQSVRPAASWRDWRHRILVGSRAKIRSAIEDKEVAGVVLALVLGDRHGLQEVGKVYKKAGVMHVLAVSGLHVGLLYGLLVFLFGLLTALCGGWLGRPRHHRWAALSILWIYAALVGFPPSVVRAAGGLSLMVLARKLMLPYDKINGLCVLLFFCLLYNPYWLFDVGFQLSFMAMAGIFIFYSPIVNTYTPKHRPMRYWWQGAALSIAAQVGTSPLSIYYFHHFPLYFLLGNAIMVPMVACLLILGFVLLSYSWLDVQGRFMSDFLTFLVRKTTAYLRWIGDLPGAHLGPFHWCAWVVVFYYLILGCLYLGVRYRRFRYLVLATTLFSLVSLASIRYQLMHTTQKRIVVYDVAPHSVIGFVEGRKAVLLGDRIMDAGVGYYRHQVQPSLDWWGIKSIVQRSLSGMSSSEVFCRKVCGLQVYTWAGKRIAVTDKNHVCSTTCGGREHLVLDVLCIMDEPVHDLGGWIKGMKIGLILLGQENKRHASLVKQAERLGIPVKIGSYVLPCG